MAPSGPPKVGKQVVDRLEDLPTRTIRPGPTARGDQREAGARLCWPDITPARGRAARGRRSCLWPLPLRPAAYGNPAAIADAPGPGGFARTGGAGSEGVNCEFRPPTEQPLETIPPLRCLADRYSPNPGGPARHPDRFVLGTLLGRSHRGPKPVGVFRQLRRERRGDRTLLEAKNLPRRGYRFAPRPSRGKFSPDAHPPAPWRKRGTALGEGNCWCQQAPQQTIAAGGPQPEPQADTAVLALGRMSLALRLSHRSPRAKRRGRFVGNVAMEASWVSQASFHSRRAFTVAGPRTRAVETLLHVANAFTLKRAGLKGPPRWPDEDKFFAAGYRLAPTASPPGAGEQAPRASRVAPEAIGLAGGAVKPADGMRRPRPAHAQGNHGRPARSSSPLNPVHHAAWRQLLS